MARSIGRRELLTKSALVATAGAVAAVATTGGAEAAAPAAHRGSAKPAIVGRHQGDLAEVTVGGSGKAEMLPLIGFVPGWRLRPGDRVVVTTEIGSGKRYVEPLFSFVAGRADRTPSHAQATIEIAGKTVVLRDATAIYPGDSSTTYMAHYIPNVSEPDVWATMMRPAE